MCSIGGEINYNNYMEICDYHKEMISSMKRRGPDDDNIYSAKHAVLLHARLAVIDPNGGKQPMSCAKNNIVYTIVYNGELYNTKELKNTLQKDGEIFDTSSDTEVVLKAYIRYGEKCLSMFNGIFAFAVWNETENSLFMARDPMGVKPFFYKHDDKRFVFASEMKTLFKHPDISAKIDLNGIAELMLIGPGRTPGYGVFKDIFELKPGYCGFFDKSGLITKKYSELTAKKHTDSVELTIEKIKFLITDSVEKQLVSDVPIGTFLSGGLDSSIISSVASKYFKKRGEKLKTFSVTYRDNEKFFKKSHFQPNSDEAYIKIMQQYLDSEHTTVILDTPDLVNSLYNAVDARDLPGMADVDSSLLLFCEKIKKHVTVALSGECADEIFCGYPWYRDEKIRSAYGFPWAQSTMYRSEFLNAKYKNAIDASEYVNSLYDEYIELAPKIESDSPLEKRMKEMVYINMHWFMQTLLDRKDRMSMYSGLEVRVPFCDKRIAEYMYSVPWEYKDYMGREKGILRKAAEELLPESVLWRKKNPYPKTHNPAYLAAVSEILIDILDDKDSPIFEIADYDAVKNLLITERNEPWYGQLMTTPQTIAYIIQLNYWLKKYNVKICA